MTYQTMLECTRDGDFYCLKADYLNSIWEDDKHNIRDMDSCFVVIDTIYHTFLDNTEDIYEDEVFDSDNSYDNREILKAYNSYLYCLTRLFSNCVIRFDPASKFRKFVHSEFRHNYSREQCDNIITKCNFIYDVIQRHVNKLISLMYKSVSDEALCVTSRALDTLKSETEKLEFVRDYND